MWFMLDHNQNRSIHHSLRKKMNYKDLQKRFEYLSCLLADIEDTSLLEESMELNEEEAKDFLLSRIHHFLYEEFKDTEDQLERFSSIETWTMVKDSD